MDRLSELTEKVEREPLVRTAANVADGGGGGCSLFKRGSVGALGSIALDSYGADHSARRNGPVAAEISTLLGRAKTLAAKGNQ